MTGFPKSTYGAGFPPSRSGAYPLSLVPFVELIYVYWLEEGMLFQSLNRILAIPMEERKKGVVAASAGNHAQGVARAAHDLELRPGALGRVAGVTCDSREHRPAARFCWQKQAFRPEFGSAKVELFFKKGKADDDLAEKLKESQRSGSCARLPPSRNPSAQKRYLSRMEITALRRCLELLTSILPYMVVAYPCQLDRFCLRS